MEAHGHSRSFSMHSTTATTYRRSITTPNLPDLDKAQELELPPVEQASAKIRLL